MRELRREQLAADFDGVDDLDYIEDEDEEYFVPSNDRQI